MPVTLDVPQQVRLGLARRAKRQADLARTLHMSPQAMSRRMTGEVPFNVDELAAIARFLDMPVAQLLGEP